MKDGGSRDASTSLLRRRDHQELTAAAATAAAAASADTQSAIEGAREPVSVFAFVCSVWTAAAMGACLRAICLQIARVPSSFLSVSPCV